MNFRLTSEDANGAALTGAGAIDLNFSKGRLYKVAEVRLTLGAVAADLGDFKVKIGSALGAAWDHQLATPDPMEDLASVTSFRYADPQPPIVITGDTLDISWPNTGGVTWAVEVIGEKVKE